MIGVGRQPADGSTQSAHGHDHRDCMERHDHWVDDESDSVVAILSTELRTDAPMGEYGVDAARMVDRVQALPGFISMKRYVAEDGETITVARFSSEAALDGWRSDPEHLAVQERGRTQYYESYRVHICRTIRRYGFRRSAS